MVLMEGVEPSLATLSSLCLYHWATSVRWGGMRVLPPLTDTVTACALTSWVMPHLVGLCAPRAYGVIRTLGHLHTKEVLFH